MTMLKTQCTHVAVLQGEIFLLNQINPGTDAREEDDPESYDLS